MKMQRTMIVVAFILIGLSPFATSAATNAVTIQQLIGILRANENTLSNVVVEASRVRTIFGKDDRIVQEERLELYRFSRSGELMKTESKGELHILDANSKEAPRLHVHESVFYLHGSSVRAVAGASTGSKWPDACPMPFPLLFGYGMYCVDCDGCDRALVTLSSVFEKAFAEGGLTLSEDKAAPHLVMVEIQVKPVNGFGGTSHFWIDSQRGYTLVRKKDYLSVPHTDGEVFFEGFEAVPKQYDGHWYIELARYESCPKAIEGVCSQHEQVELHVRRFETNVKFKPDNFVAPRVYTRPNLEKSPTPK